MCIYIYIYTYIHNNISPDCYVYILFEALVRLLLEEGVEGRLGLLYNTNNNITITMTIIITIAIIIIITITVTITSFSQLL